MKYAGKESSDNKIRICFCGDTMLGRLVNKRISETNTSYPWGDTLQIFDQSDLSIVNLETTLTNSNSIVPKAFNFKATPDKVQCLKKAGIELVSIANNHILDYDVKGLLETIEVLDKAQIVHVGAGRNADEAARGAIVGRGGITIGMLGYTDNEPTWKADSQPGVNYIDIGDIDRMEEDIPKLAKEVDILIVSLHWGPNMREKPPPHFLAFAHKIIDLGADIIHGHSAHIFQGIEFYQKGVIIYDTGDFVDDYVVDPQLRNDLFFMFVCEVSKTGVEQLALIPVKIDAMQVNLAVNADRKWAIDRMTSLIRSLDPEQNTPEKIKYMGVDAWKFEMDQMS